MNNKNLNLNLTFIGTYYYIDRIEDFRNSDKDYMLDNAAHKFQDGLIDGFKYFFDNIYIFSQPNTRNFPLFSRKILFKTTKYDTGVSIGFLNVPIINHCSRFIMLFYFLLKSRVEIRNSVLIVYSLHSPFLISVVLFKYFINRKQRTTLVIPDLPQFMSSNKSLIYKALKKIDAFIIHKCIDYFDSYVIIAESMSSKLSFQNKPYTVIEGIYKSDTKKNTLSKEIERVILYTGSLDKRYGLHNLLKAFMLIPNVNFRLWICGSGNSESFIKKCIEDDNRIIFFGQISHDEIFQLQRKAWVLINPRMSVGEYVNFSFPSKIIEYFASGTPTLMYKLPGIPLEYYDYCYLIGGNSINELRNSIIITLSKHSDELKTKGDAAKSFILKNKTSKIQVSKLLQKINF
jgi:glycosyltransferase involved in cell wall biosynthesis